jgi:hypothetical protein
VLVAERLIRARALVAVALGAGLGLWIFGSYALAWNGVKALEARIGCEPAAPHSDPFREHT